MNLVSATILETRKLSVRIDAIVNDTIVSGELAAKTYVTNGEAMIGVAHINIHEGGMGVDLFLSEELELGEPVKVCFGDGRCINAVIGDILYSTLGFEAKYFYGGALGALYTRESTVFRLWAPAASAVILYLYTTSSDKAYKSVKLTKDTKGVFQAALEGDFNNVCYCYEVTVGECTSRCVDPYAIATTENARLGVILDLFSTNPQGWAAGAHVLPQNPTDAILYEIHVRDFTISPDSGVKLKGKYLGFAEEGTVSPQGEKTGLEHLKELGITHVHLMPVMDYATVDESNFDSCSYNWGYDPCGYFVPDGSYSVNPNSGAARIREFKTLVNALHKNGIGVVMDVVYNHTYFTETSPLNLVMPDYYYRKSGGTFSNGSGCGNELASERGMVRKLMTDSLLYWVQEYNIDGFRFDLMGVHDIQTMNYIRHRLDEIDSRILIYGEGWQGGSSALPGDIAATKDNAVKLSDRIALFNDDMRDAIKGNAFTAGNKGYLGASLNSHQYSGFSEVIKSGIVGATAHPHVMYQNGNYPFAKRPTQTVTYDSAHDNYTLYDKLCIANPELSEETLIKLNKLAAVLVLTAQGIPFLHGGEEFLRRKLRPDGTPEGNSYRSPDSVNQLCWERKHTHRDVFDYYRGLIAFRRAHKALRMTTAEDTSKLLRFLYTAPENRICFRITADAAGDTAQRIVVIINPTSDVFSCRFTSEYEPDASYSVYADGSHAGNIPLYTVTGDTVTVSPVSALILVKE